MKDIQRRFEFLLNLIYREGTRLKFALNQHPHLNVSYKDQDDLVTQFDVAVEKSIIESIKSAFPKDQFCSEETHDQITALEAFTWIIDPIDGTTNFVHGYPVFCLSIAFSHNQTLHGGAVFNPIQNELFFALKGHGAYLNNKQLYPIKPRPPTKSLLVTGFPYQKKVSQQRHQLAIALFSKFQTSTQAVRRDGSAALDLCYVGAGRFNGFFETGLHPWDVAAGMVISAEVGATHVDFEGNPTTIFGNELVCAHPQLASKIVKDIQKIKGEILI
jgi:myo-inositol-1(or 4)-monophosphatase